MTIIIRGRAFATFAIIEKVLAGSKKSFRRPYVVQACVFYNLWFSKFIPLEGEIYPSVEKPKPGIRTVEITISTYFVQKIDTEKL